MGADRNQWQFPKNEVGKVIGWSDEASPSNPSASKGLVNKGPFATPADLAGKQDAHANLDTLSETTLGATGLDILADATPADARETLQLESYVNETLGLKKHPLDLPQFISHAKEGVHFFTGPFQRASGIAEEAGSARWRMIFGKGKAHSRQNSDELAWEMPYDGGTGAFTVGQVVTQAATLNFEAASATITAIDGDATSGTLTLSTPVGVFRDNEAITDPLGGAAVVNLPHGRMQLRRIIGRTLWIADSQDGMQTWQNFRALPGQLYWRVSFTSQTANFTVGQLLSNSSGTVVGRIRSQSDSGTTGYLIVAPHGTTSPGTLTPTTLITDAAGGSATVNGFPAPEDIERDYQGWCMEKTGTGRWIIMAQAQRTEGQNEVHIWRSDDEGETWTHDPITGLPSAYFPACAAAVPASMGGHDTENMTFFCYGGPQVRLFYSNDNGITWLTKHYSPPGSQLLSEPTPLIVPGKGLVVVCRDERPDMVRPSLSLVGPTLTTLGTAVENGLPLGGNQPIFHQEDGDPFAYLYARSVNGRNTGVGVSRFGYAKMNASALYDAGGVFDTTEFTDAGPIPMTIQSHFHRAKDEHGRWHFACGLESNVDNLAFNSSRPGETFTLIFTPYKPAPITLGAVRDMSYVANLFDNPGFNYRPYGDTFSGVASQKFGRWQAVATGGTFNATFGKLPYWLHRNAHYNSIDYCRIARLTGTGAFRLYQRWYGRDALHFFANRSCLVQCSMWGKSAADASVGVAMFFGTGGSPAFGEVLTNPASEGPMEGLFRLSCTAAFPDIESKTISADCYVEVYISSTFSSGWNVMFFDPSFTFGNHPRPVLMNDPEREKPNLARYAEVIELSQFIPLCSTMRVSDLVHRGVFNYQPKRAVPSISLVGTTAAASDFVLTKTDGAGGVSDVAVSAMSFSPARDRARVVITSSSSSDMVHHLAYGAATSGSTKILIDAEG